MISQVRMEATYGDCLRTEKKWEYIISTIRPLEPKWQYTVLSHQYSLAHKLVTACIITE